MFPLKPMLLEYCDHIMDITKKALTISRSFNVLQTKWDLDPEGGYLVSTKKTMIVEDKNMKKYKITIEEMHK